ncbi:MAG: di-trans,poly-cis-decaprenylcistransferase [Blastocatellia bacterium]|nr:di-trans,poly-cis-decaprenylcistransferase [Blastocatellia bacterium]
MQRGLHVAIIMDGNGRWAAARGLPRTAGHRVGAEAVRRTIQGAIASGITTLTLYAFSTDNWKRPVAEVNELMRLFRLHLLKEARQCTKQGIRLTIIGRRDRLPSAVRMAMEAAEALTRRGDKLHLRIAIDYSAREAILQTIGKITAPLSREEFSALLNSDTPVSEVDLLIRTSGEQRLSDFLLWESAYAELYFTKVLWPDFGQQDLLVALNAYHARDRRFGSIQAAEAA